MEQLTNSPSRRHAEGETMKPPTISFPAHTYGKAAMLERQRQRLAGELNRMKRRRKKK